MTKSILIKFCFAAFILNPAFQFAQITLSGKFIDRSNEPLPGAVIKVLTEDSNFVTGSISDMDGKFEFSLKANTKYFLTATLISYKPFKKLIEVKNEALNLGVLRLRENGQNLQEVEVKTTQTRGEQKGDTTAFNAAAYKTNPDASAEDLIKKMPGVTTDNEGLKVNGEAVQKVLVDGKPFFGDDPNTTLKNLPADLIDKVEVFDRMSDQSQFTGFNDGDQQKTINLVTKKNKNKGQFGKIYAGGGVDEANQGRYNAGAVINNFKDKQRFSLLMMSNNINQQNFSIADITGAMGSNTQNTRGGGRNRSNTGLMTTPQNGNTTTQSAGMNYSDEWGKKINVSGSYFFNHTVNNNQSSIVRNYFTNNKLIYDQENDDKKTNQNHRLNFRFEYAIDSANKLTVTPALSFQDNRATSIIIGSNKILENIFLSETNTNSKNNNLGYDFSNAILYQHKFKKVGRTISLNVNTQLNERDNNGSYVSSSTFNDSIANNLNQNFKTYSYTKKINANLAYTEGFGKYSQVQLNYNPSYTEGKSDKSTRDINLNTGIYDDFNSLLSNKYTNVYETQRAGLSYKYRKDKINLSIGADAQQSTLQGNQSFPTTFSLNLPFRNILPNAQLNYKIDKSKNLRINYRSSTDIPSISQLQNVVDISNPLQVKTGNTSLKQTFENNIGIRFGGFNQQSSRNAMIFMNAGTIDNYISNATYILNNDTIVEGFVLRQGSQLTKPVNLKGYYSGRAFFVFGFPIKKIKSNLNFNGGINFNRTPSVINNLYNFSNNYATNGGLFLGSNISENLDFSIGYTGNYTIVKNTVNTQSDNNFFSHSANFKLNWIFLKGIVFSTDLNHSLYKGLSQSFNQEFLLWNASLGYKFLKNKSLEAKISVFDILNKNRSINRLVTGAYTEDSYTNVLRRYGLFSLTYTFRKINAGSKIPKQEENQEGFRPPMMPQKQN